MKYRIVTNGEWYEIEWRLKYIPFSWSRYSPSDYEYLRDEPIDWSKYRFDTKEDARELIQELKEEKKKSNFEPID